ncbi:MAG: hypothetical protein ACJLS2_13195 [Microcella pacifica]
MTNYAVDAEHTGKWWVLQCREFPGAITQVRRLDQADQIVEAISFVSGDSPDTITVTVKPRLPDELGALISTAQAQRQRARELEASAARDLTRGARELVAHGLSQRDAAVILGVSHQRVHQLVTADALSTG